MSQTCPNCGQMVQPGHRFCSSCGHAMSAGTPATSTSPGGSDIAQPVTYVVQRYDGSPQPDDAPSAARATSEMPDQSAEPFPAFVPPLSSPPVLESTNTLSSLPGSMSQAGVVPPPPTRAYEIPQAGTGTSSYGNYTTPPSTRGQAGAFAPYSADVAKPLEKPVQQRSWLMPVILASAAVLLLLVLGGGYLLLSNKSNSTTSSIQSKLPANASEEDRVKEVVQMSNDEQIKAWRDLDPDVLKGTRVGQVLQENVEMVQTLKKQNMYAVPVNQSLKFEYVKVQGDTATVRTVETWTVTFFKKSDNTAVQKNGPDTLHETYSMVKQNGKWMVTQLQIDGQPGSTSPGSTPTLPST